MERVLFRAEVHLAPGWAQAMLRSAQRARESLSSNCARLRLDEVTGKMRTLLQNAIAQGTLPREAVLDLLVLFLETAEVAHAAGENSLGFEMEGIEARLLDLLLGEWSGGESQAEEASGCS